MTRAGLHQKFQQPDQVCSRPDMGSDLCRANSYCSVLADFSSEPCRALETTFNILCLYPRVDEVD